jgi:tetratricopeptide (TPR) repeat protein
VNAHAGRSLVLAMSAAALLGVAVWLQATRDRVFPAAQSEDETLYLTRRAASRVVFTHRSLAADLYWIRTIQYYGERTRRLRAQDALEPPPALAAQPPVTFDLLYPLLDITTTLDPRFNIAYRFGAIFLSEERPHGPGRPDLAIALLEKALQVMPDKWDYWEDIGFVYYWNVHDYVKAAAAFNRAADLPKAPWWLRSLAATMLAKGGQRSVSRTLWQQLYNSATDESARNAALTKLRQLDALDIIESLQERIDAFVQRRGTPVTGWRTLVVAGVVRGIPLDPVGVPLELDDSSTVRLSRGSPLFPLPVEPAPRARMNGAGDSRESGPQGTVPRGERPGGSRGSGP